MQITYHRIQAYYIYDVVSILELSEKECGIQVTTFVCSISTLTLLSFSTSSAKLSPHIGSHQIGNRRGEQLKCTSPTIMGGGVITLQILNSYCHNIIRGSLYRTRLQMERQNNSKPSSWKNKQMWGC